MIGFHYHFSLSLKDEGIIFSNQDNISCLNNDNSMIAMQIMTETTVNFAKEFQKV